MALVKTYLLAPSFDFRPDGPIALGNIIADPFRPHRVLTKADPGTVQPETETTSRDAIVRYRGTGHGMSVRVWAQFLAILGFNPGTDDLNKNDGPLYTMRSLKTFYLKSDPSDPELRRRVNIPSVRNVLRPGYFRSRPVYMITGIKIAENLEVPTGNGVHKGVNTGASAPVAEGVSVGGNMELTKDTSQRGSFRARKEVVFAYQLSEIRLRGWGKDILKVKGFMPKAAAFLEKEAFYIRVEMDNATATSLSALEREDIPWKAVGVNNRDFRCYSVASNSECQTSTVLAHTPRSSTLNILGMDPEPQEDSPNISQSTHETWYTSTNLGERLQNLRSKSPQDGTQALPSITNEDVKVLSPPLEDVSLNTQMRSILDPQKYFSHLEDLERRVSGLFPDLKAEKIEENAIAHLRMHEHERVNNVDPLEEAQGALSMLDQAGFSKGWFTILSQDPLRPEVAMALKITQKDLAVLRTAIQSTHAEDVASHHYLQSTVCRILPFLQSHGRSAAPEDSQLALHQTAMKILQIGLVSYSGSHTCRFDQTIFDIDSTIFDLSSNIHLRLVELSCLRGLLGGPVWMFCNSHADTSRRFSISIDVASFDDLWGPLWGNPTDCTSLKAPQHTEDQGRLPLGTNSQTGIDAVCSRLQAIGTERGVVYATTGISENKTLLVPTGIIRETGCHWCPWEEAREQPVFEIQMENNLLIGTPSPIRASDRSRTGLHEEYCKVQRRSDCLHWNEGCRGDLQKTQEALAKRFNLVGTARPGWVVDAYQQNLGLSLHGFSANSGITVKRTPGTTHKARLITLAQSPNLDYLREILGLNVGLEVSSCTGHAQRTTLWNAIRISNGNEPSQRGSPAGLSCTHQVGDPNCVRSCWNMEGIACFEGIGVGSSGSNNNRVSSQSNLKGKQPAVHFTEQFRDFLRARLDILQCTGVNAAGELEVLWPFGTGNSLHSLSIPPNSRSWFPMLKDTWCVSTFATASPRCLELRVGYKGIEGIIPASTRCSTFAGKEQRSLQNQPNSQLVLQTTLLGDLVDRGNQKEAEFVIDGVGVLNNLRCDGMSVMRLNCGGLKRVVHGFLYTKSPRVVWEEVSHDLTNSTRAHVFIV